MTTTTVDELDFTNLDHQEGEWDDSLGIRHRYLRRASGIGFYAWVLDTTPVVDDEGYELEPRERWLWAGLVVSLGGPFTRVDGAAELGEDADIFLGDWLNY